MTLLSKHLKTKNKFSDIEKHKNSKDIIAGRNKRSGGDGRVNSSFIQNDGDKSPY